MDHPCEICGTSQNLDRHHVIPKCMGGSKNPAVHDESNLMILCRSCHRKVHQGPWELVRSQDCIRVVDRNTGEQVMRRLTNPYVDIPALFQLFNLAEDSLSRLYQAVPYFTDEQLVEAFAYTSSFGKRSWLVQAAILYEAQQRSIYGDRTLEAIARRFEISLRQAQKYSLVWKVFFSPGGEEENVNVDAILLDEPSWYVVAAAETRDPEKWLAYAQDRKMEDSRYSVATFRREIQQSRLTEATADTHDFKEAQQPIAELPGLEHRACPWIELFCSHSGKPLPFQECRDCEFS